MWILKRKSSSFFVFLTKIKPFFGDLSNLCLSEEIIKCSPMMVYLLYLLLVLDLLYSGIPFRYLYVCATTVCVYIGVSVVAATVAYTYSVAVFRRTIRASAVMEDAR